MLESTQLSIVTCQKSGEELQHSMAFVHSIWDLYYLGDEGPVGMPAEVIIPKYS